MCFVGNAELREGGCVWLSLVSIWYIHLKENKSKKNKTFITERMFCFDICLRRSADLSTFNSVTDNSHWCFSMHWCVPGGLDSYHC